MSGPAGLDRINKPPDFIAIAEKSCCESVAGPGCVNDRVDSYRRDLDRSGTGGEDDCRLRAAFDHDERVAQGAVDTKCGRLVPVGEKHGRIEIGEEFSGLRNPEHFDDRAR